MATPRWEAALDVSSLVRGSTAPVASSLALTSALSLAILPACISICSRLPAVQQDESKQAHLVPRRHALQLQGRGRLPAARPVVERSGELQVLTGGLQLPD